MSDFRDEPGTTGDTYHSDSHDDDSYDSDTGAPTEAPHSLAPIAVSSPGLVSSASAPPASQVSSAWAESTSTDVPAENEANHEPIVTPTVYLTAIEARVLGSLVEKSFLTPDTYPMTTNAMVTACNQKTNRDPVVAYSAVEVDAVLIDLRQRNLVRRVHSQGSRSTKHRQTLDEELALNDRELALVSVLLLRGPQTIGELRLRTERHGVGFDDLDAVENCLSGMASRITPLVVQLERQPGHKEARWQHLLADDAEQVTPTASAAQTPAQTNPAASSMPAPIPTAATPPMAATPSTAATPLVAAAPAAPTADTNALEGRVRALEAEVLTLRQQLSGLAAQLGETLE